MNAVKLKNILSLLDKVGIHEVVFEPTEDESGTLIRGANKEKNITVFDTIEDNLVDLPMGVQSVKGLLSRINLFDLDKASIDLRDSGDIITAITIKVGRKRAGFKLALPSQLKVPRMVPGSLESDDVIEFSDEYVKYLSSAIMAMSYTGEKKERTISLFQEDGSAAITIFDGEDDSFHDVLDDADIDLSDKASWEVVPFERVMKASLEEVGAAKFFITEHHIAVFDMGELDIMVVPII